MYAWMGLLPLSVRTPLAHSASLALENWTGRNNNEAEKKGKEAERVKLACGARDNAPGCGRRGGSRGRHKSQTTDQFKPCNNRKSTQLISTTTPT